MDPSQPRFGGPTRRRSFTPTQKLDHVAAYEADTLVGKEFLGENHIGRTNIRKARNDVCAAKKLGFKPVTVGIEDRGGFSEIASGLKGNEPVVMAPAAETAKFKEGMKVRVAQ
jgi:hypothetical protein